MPNLDRSIRNVTYHHSASSGGGSIPRSSLSTDRVVRILLGGRRMRACTPIQPQQRELNLLGVWIGLETSSSKGDCSVERTGIVSATQPSR